MTDDSKRLEAHSVSTKSTAAKQAAQSVKTGKETSARPSLSTDRPLTR